MEAPKALQAIINNPLVKAALFKQLRKVMKDNNIELLTLAWNPDGSIKVDVFQEQMQVMPKKDYAEMVNKVFNAKNPME